MRLLVTGAGGQLGQELAQSLTKLGTVIALDRNALDLSQADGIRAAVRAHAPQVIVNAGAYTAVDKAESEPELAQIINAVAPAVLAEEARQLGALLVHYSTDYVFDGSKFGPYVEDDATHPLSVYGRSKLGGEQAILGSGCRHLIFRTSWVYSPRGKNFLLTMLQLLKARPQLSVVDDQIGAPTSTRLIANATLEVLHQGAPHPGLFHLTAAGHTSWYGFTKFIAEISGASAAIQAIPSSAYPTAARRPLNSRLNCSKLVSSYGLALPLWDAEARSVIAGMAPAA